MPKPNFKRAFTLIELLVVMGIIAVLAGAIMYSTDNARAKARDSQRKTALEVIRTAAVAYYTDNGEFPEVCNPQGDVDPNLTLPTCTDSVASTTIFTSANAIDLNNWFPALNNYIQDGKVPVDPNQTTSSKPTGIAAIPGLIASWFPATSKSASDQNGQVASTFTKRITAGADDVQIQHFAPDFTANNASGGMGLGRSDIPDASTAPYPNNDHMKVGLRFTGVTIPKDAHIISAKLTFKERNVTTQQQTLNNAGTSGPINQKVNIFITSDISQANSSQITSSNDFYGRLGSINTLNPNHFATWREIPQWNPPANTSATQVDITNIIQNNVQIAGWASGNAMNILMHPEDPPSAYEMTLDSRARFFESFESNSSQAPELSIEWDNTPIPSPTPPPAGSLISCEAEDFTISGGYEIVDPGSSYPASGTGGSPGRAIWRPEGGLDDIPYGENPGGLGTATKQVYIENPNTYYFWARVRYPNSSVDDSFFLENPNNSSEKIIVGNEGSGASFHWVNFRDGNSSNKISFALTQGTKNIKLYVREDANKIDKIVLSDSSTYIPSGYGPAVYCPSTGGAPTPTPTAAPTSGPTPPPSPIPSPNVPQGDDECVDACRVGYQLGNNKKWFRLWVILENDNDPQRAEGPDGQTGPNAICNPTQAEKDKMNPSNKTLYCIESPPI